MAAEAKYSGRPMMLLVLVQLVTKFLAILLAFDLKHSGKWRRKFFRRFVSQSYVSSVDEIGRWMNGLDKRKRGVGGHGIKPSYEPGFEKFWEGASENGYCPPYAYVRA
jgi:hypothetical protein